MRISTRKHTSFKVKAREKKRLRIRKTVSGSLERPRLSVYRSTRHVYAQIIDDTKGVTLAAASTQTLEGQSGSSKETAAAVGREIAKLALSKKIKAVVFDRSGYLYHGRIQALAEAARAGGLEF